MKSLVVYFSHTGENIVNFQTLCINKGFTEIVAEKIKEYTNSDIFKLVEVSTYPSDYDSCNKRAQVELENGILPEIKELPKSIDEYDTIYLGFPIWYRTYPRIILSFLNNFNFNGKVIKPFCTNEEGAFGFGEIELLEHAKGAIIKDGLAIRGYDASVSDDKIKNWVNK